jgi:mono/diheme cytochrome c family protein
MSTPSSPQGDHHIAPVSTSDADLVESHAKAAGKQADEKGHYSLLPLGLIFGSSALIFWASVYVVKFSGHYDPKVFDETAPPSTGVEVVAKVDPIALGKKQYLSACVACHQPDGKGIAGVNPPLAGADWVLGSEERLVRIVVHGLKGPITVNGNQYNGAMPVFGRVAGSGYNWSDDKIAAVLTYIRQEWGNTGGPVSTELVAAVRAKEGNRKEWTAEELLALP